MTHDGESEHPDGPYCFRIRFALGNTVGIATDESRLVLATSDVDGEDVYLEGRDNPDGLLSEARTVIVRGGRFATASAAEAAAKRWMALVQLAFARMNIGADFGGRAPSGGLTEEGIRSFTPAGEDVQALNDVHGPMVFQCAPPAMFFSVGNITLRVGKPAERVVEVVRAAKERSLGLTEQQQLAYDLYSASFFEDSADARFIMLMMALETLIQPQPRSREVADLVSRLVDTVTQDSTIAQSERDSIIGSLRFLATESIGQAGRQLAQRLGERRYMDGTESAREFFTNCYTMRSRLVHGSFPRPGRSDVGRRGASLEVFMSHVLGLSLLADFDF
jgi:hypothetical protein